jgi:hypothetical protein
MLKVIMSMSSTRLASSGKIESFTPPTEADINAIAKAAEEDRGDGRIEIKGGKLVYTPGSELKGPAMHQR